MLRIVIQLLILAALSACAAPLQYTGHYDRPNYEGSGPFVRDLHASRAEASTYRAHASQHYRQPGPLDDRWGPYVTEAANRFGIPERWVREVMRQESGGRPHGADGILITSWAGAMGLMQVMPSTYDMLRRRYALGDDPYDPHDNIMAGSAYIREMYDRFGAPNFLAAYNAGPERVQDFLTNGSLLPAETVRYMAQVAPRLGDEAAESGSFTVAANDNDWPRSFRRPRPRLAAARTKSSSTIMTDLAEGGESESGPRPSRLLATVAVPLRRLPSGTGNWAVEVGAFTDAATSRATMRAVRATVDQGLAYTPSVFIPEQHGGTTLYHAKLVGLTAEDAATACDSLIRHGLHCFAVPPGS